MKAIAIVEAFMKEISFRFPRGFQLPDLAAVLDLVATGRLAVNDVLSRTFYPREAPEAYRLLLGSGVPGTVEFDWTGDQ